MKVHRSAFVPPPKVMSAVVHLRAGAQPEGVRAETLERLTGAAFGQRRKMLRRSVAGLPGALEALAELGIDPVDWLGDPDWSMPAIILFAAWKNFGYNMIILLAALQAVPRELYESARVDGAGAMRQFSDLTVPMLLPTLVMVGILTLAGYFQLFAEPYVMTQGGPAQRTVTVLYLMYEEGFKWWSLGSASADLGNRVSPRSYRSSVS